MRFLLIFCLVFYFLFIGCQKGPDDPAISFLSRKSRLAAKWTMVGGSASYTYQNRNVSYVFDGTQVKRYETYTGGVPAFYYGKYNLSLEIKKSGSFHYFETVPGNTLEFEGNWSFNTGDGETKSKEQVAFFIDKAVRGKMYDGFMNQSASSFVYTLSQLRHDKMEMSAAGFYGDPNKDGVKYTVHYVFEVK